MTMITINNIHLAFKNELIKNGSLVLPYGTVTGLIGKSGAGKTALLEVVGLLSNQTFDYQFDELALSQLNQEQINDIRRNDVSFIFQDVQLFEDMTLKENLEFYAVVANKQVSIEDIYEKLHYVNLNIDINTDVKTMSIGERQRLAILCGLMKDAKLFIFDEPTAYLDRRNKEIVLEIIFKLAKEMNKIILIATHDKKVIEQLERVYSIENKELNLIKDCPYKSENHHHHFHSLQADVLNKYSQHKEKKKKHFYIFLSFIIGLIISCCTFSLIFTYDYQNRFNDDLLDILNYKILIAKKDKSFITPDDYATIESQITNNVYPYIVLDAKASYKQEPLKTISILPYHTFEKLDNHILEKTGESHYYVSYQLNRILKNNKENICIFKNTKFPFDNNQILEPSLNNLATLYIPYDEYRELLNKNNIDIYNMDFQTYCIQLNHPQEIKEIMEHIGNEYTITSLDSLETRLTILNIFNPNIMIIIDIVVILLFIAYQIYQIIAYHKEIALLKSLGIRNSDLMKMRIREINYLLLKIISFSIIILVLFMAVTSTWNIVLMIELLLLHVVMIYISLYFSYYYFIKKYTVSLLLRKS